MIDLHVTLRRSTDTVKTDLELICDQCGQHLCDAEDGDWLSVLADLAEQHQKTKHLPPFTIRPVHGGNPAEPLQWECECGSKTRYPETHLQRQHGGGILESPGKSITITRGVTA